MQPLLHDLRYTLRSLARAKTFTCVAILSLALGAAAATTIFSLVNGIVLQPLAYRDPGQLVHLHEVVPALQHLYPNFPVNLYHFRYWQSHSQTFDSMAALRSSRVTFTGGGDPERVDTAEVTADLFRVLGVSPALGRGFVKEEDRPGAPVAVITDSLWRRRLGASPRALNSTILLNGNPYQIIGILPANFRFPRNDDLGTLEQLGAHTEIFRPVVHVIDDWEGDYDYAVLARLASGRTIRQGLAEINILERQIAAAHLNNEAIHAEALPLRESIASPVSSALYTLLAAVLVLEFIVCVNLANLTFARTNVRAREFSIRTALGAGRSRIVKQVLYETLVLGIVGGVLGMLAAAAALRMFIAFAPVNIPRLDEVTIDWRVLLFSFTLSLACGLLSGLIPALRIVRMSPQETLKSASHTVSGTRHDLRLRELMVGIEVALSAILLVCAGLLVTSLQKVLHIDRGFGVRHAITFGVQLPSSYRQPADRNRFFDRLLHDLASIPAVDAVGYVARLPLMGESAVNHIRLEGASEGALDPATREHIFINGRDSSPDYFRAMGIALLKGRIFEERDRGRSVAVISGRLAAKLWPGRDPLGARFDAGFGLATLQVVGVVQDVHNSKLEKDPTLIVYYPYWLRAPASGDIVIRSSIEPPALMPEVRRSVAAIDSAVPVAQMRTIDDLVSDATSQRRFQMEIVLGFAAAALLLALIGIYGVVSYAAAQRRFEMGLRAALGARPRDILGLMTVAGMRPIAWGLVAGIAGAAACGRLVRGLLYGVSPLDITTMLSVAALLAVAGALACWLPGRAVSKVDPATVLRYE